MASKSKKPPFGGNAELIEKDRIVKRLNERITSIVRHAGAQNEEVMRWQSKLTRPRSPYVSKTKSYNPEKIKLDKNKKHTETEQFQLLSRSQKDLEKMSLKDLQRLEDQTRGWGSVRKEAADALTQQAQIQQDVVPFEGAKRPPKPVISEQAIIEYINQKQAVREFIEGNTDAFYALIEATGWDDIRDHTTQEIYDQVKQLNMGTYKFKAPLGEIGSDYIRRRDASRERRRAIGL